MRANWRPRRLVAGLAVALCPTAGAEPLLHVTAVRFWTLGEVTRVAVEVSGEFKYKSDKLSNPERLFFDIAGARLRLGGPQRGIQTIPVGGNLLKQIRVAQTKLDVARVVLDLTGPADKTVSQLENPNRLIIELRVAADRPVLTPPPPTVSQTERERPAVAAPAGTGGNLQMERPGVAEMASRTTPGGNETRRDRGAAAAGGTVADSRAERPLVSMVGPGTTTGGDETRRDRGAAGVVGDPRTERPAGSVPAKRATAGGDETRREKPAAAETVADASPASAVAGKGDVLVAEQKSPAEGAAGAVAALRKPGGETAAGPPPAVPAKKNSNGGRSLTRVLGLKVDKVVIDPGHGGHDHGTTGPGGLKEKDLVLDVALRLGRLIESRLGSEVVYTRTDDTFIPLEERTAIANRNRADLFLSIHVNSSPYPSAAGIETYYLNFTDSKMDLEVAARENAGHGKSVYELSDVLQKIAKQDKRDESREFAAKIQGALYPLSARNNSSAKNRGVKKAPFVVLIGASMPSVLTEIGFVTNRREETQLKSPEYRQKVAEALYRGIAQYASTLSHYSVARREAPESSLP